MATSREKTSEDSGLESTGSEEHPQDFPSDCEYVSPKEFAILYRISLSTVRRYLGGGKLPKIQFGGHRCRVLIPRDAGNGLRAVTVNSEECSVTPSTTSRTDSKDPEQEKHRRHGPAPKWTKRR
jgi:hypothetical protein